MGSVRIQGEVAKHDSEWLTVDDVARALRVLPKAVRDWQRSGAIESHIIGGLIRFHKDTINGLLRNQDFMARIIPMQRYTKLQRARLKTTADLLAIARPWPKTGCGVYFLICEGEIVYVGQALNVGARIAAHAADKTFDAWSWLPCRRNALDITERAYINALMPKLNRDAHTTVRRTWTK